MFVLTEEVIARHVAVLKARKKGELPKRQKGQMKLEKKDEHSAAHFLESLRRRGVRSRLLDTPAGRDLTAELKRRGLELTRDESGQWMRLSRSAGIGRSPKDDKHAEKLNNLEPGRNPVDPDLNSYLNGLRRYGRTTGPSKRLAAALARHDLKLEERILEGEGRRRWYLVDAPGESKKRVARVGVGVEEGLGPGQSVFPAGGVGADTGPSSWSAGGGSGVHAVRAGGKMVAEMSMPHNAELFEGKDLDEALAFAADKDWFGDVELDGALRCAVANDWPGSVGTDGGPHSAATQGELSSGLDALESYGSWSAAPVNSAAPYLGEFSNPGVAALSWGAGGPAGAASGYPPVGSSAYSATGPSAGRSR
ncbi:hypothetical protein ACWD5R_23155 [Streptomyces sp. NPDC002514]|uniref:hypothetical protein n=1 Tax=Streptomyces sp. NPDC001270 TaxID=3364554 RepID=UPI0036A3E35A